jgi:hypothetical protein
VHTLEGEQMSAFLVAAAMIRRASSRVTVLCEVLMKSPWARDCSPTVGCGQGRV